MTLLESLVLGILQGMTEFLPISSSGHLVLADALFGTLSEGNLGLFVTLHVATACAALFYYRRDVGVMTRGLFSPSSPPSRKEQESLRLVVLIVLASVPTGIMGLAFGDFFEGLFQDPRTVGMSLFVTGGILFIASYYPRGRQKLAAFEWWKVVIIGLAQGAAIVPGISRSGATIAAGLMLGLQREEAVRFSFLLLIPATVGAALAHADPASMADIDLLQSVAGFLAAGLVGYLSIPLVLRWTARGRLWYFGVYCWFAAILATAAGWLM